MLDHSRRAPRRLRHLNLVATPSERSFPGASDLNQASSGLPRTTAAYPVVLTRMGFSTVVGKFVDSVASRAYDHSRDDRTMRRRQALFVASQRRQESLRDLDLGS